jgi:hypothetical protein
MVGSRSIALAGCVSALALLSCAGTYWIECLSGARRAGIIAKFEKLRTENFDPPHG